MRAHNASERAEQRALREQMRGLGMSHAEIAGEMARRFRLRPRKAWRVAWGWTLEEAAGRYNALRGKDSADAVTALTGSRLSEWENWPFSTRKPPVTGLCLLAEIYRCRVLDLIDFRDREKLATVELLTLDKAGTAPPAGEHSRHPEADIRVPLQPTRPGELDGSLSADVLAPSDLVSQLVEVPSAETMLPPEAVDALSGSALVDHSFGAERDNDPVRRRTFVGLTGTVAVSAILDAVPQPAPAGIEPLALVLTGHTADATANEAEPDLAALTAAADQARRQYQACRYSGLIRHLPGLLSRLDAARERLDGDGRLRAHALSADVHHVAAGLLLKLDDPGLACLAADQSMHAAAASQDPLAVAASARIVTHTLMNAGHMSAAVATARAHAERAARDTAARTPEALSVYGALLLRGAIAAGLHDQRSTAFELLAEADDAARQLGTDGNLRWTAFGPVNAKMHRVSIAVTLGDAGTAVEVARGIDLNAAAVTERKASLLIDVARAFLQWGRHEKAYLALRAAEHLAPEEVARRPSVRGLIGDLAASAPPGIRREAAQFAARVGAAR